MKLKKPPEKALAVTAWFLAGLLFALISGFTIYEARAQSFDPGAGLTDAELCTDGCNREHTICRDSSGGNRDSNYGDKNPFVGLAAGCDKDLHDCLRRCGQPLPKNRTPASSAN